MQCHQFLYRVFEYETTHSTHSHCQRKDPRGAVSQFFLRLNPSPHNVELANGILAVVSHAL